MSKRTWHDFDDFDDLGSKYSEAFLKEQGMRYGLDPTLPRYQREDTGSQEAFDQDGHFLRDLQIAANNDYDFRRAQEAARLSGGNVDYEFADKKWSEMSDSERKGLNREEHMANKEAGVIPDPKFANVPSSINSLEDVFYANKFMRDTWDDQELGDKDYKRGYGTSSQRAAVKDYYVDLDRSNLDLLPETDDKSDTPEVAPVDPTVPIELTDELKETRDYVANHDWTDNYYRNAAARNEGVSPPVPSEFLDPYKLNLKTGLSLAGVPTRGPGAVGTPGGFLS
tara:strand:- start:361 stop:1206 length:846 start_codon:yes stop_codon:yes gene_type:complete